MADPKSILEQLELEAADRLLSVPFFANIEVHVDPQKNIVAEVTAKIAKIKLLVAPLVASADVVHSDVPGPFFDNIELLVGVFQNPLLAGNLPSPRCVAEQVHAALHQWKPESIASLITSTKPSIRQVADKKLNIFNCSFTGSGGLGYVLPKVETPSWNAGSQTFGCATAGAAIFYTVDGRHPAPRNGTLALGPVHFNHGTTVKARAWLAGYMASDILKFTV